MLIKGLKDKSYLYLNGLKISKPVTLSDQVSLLPAKCDVDLKVMATLARHDGELGAMLLFLSLVTSQICIKEDDSKTHAMLAWNAVWDGLLIGALFNCEVACNFQSSHKAEDLSVEAKLSVTNFHLRGLVKQDYELTSKDEEWLSEHFKHARDLMDIKAFHTAVHCMSSYRWHTVPSARMALLWSGIESLFNINNEISFRLSLYVANFLGETKADREALFKEVKRLYNLRSKAVHGEKLKDGPKAVEQSAELLQRLIKACVLRKEVPNMDELVIF